MKNLLFIALLIGSAAFLSGCDKCKKVECQNSGICAEGVCDCPEGFSGTNCEVEDLCVTQAITCNNDGECIDGICDCATFFYGENCDDRCANGTYSDGVCDCERGFEASDCDTKSRDKFAGTYLIESKDDVGTSLIREGGFEHGDPWKVEITGISTFGDSDGYAEIDGNTITIPDQTVRGQGNVDYDIKTVEAGTFVDENDEISFTIKVTRQSTLPNSVEVSDSYKFTRSSL